MPWNCPHCNAKNVKAACGTCRTQNPDLKRYIVTELENLKNALIPFKTTYPSPPDLGALEYKLNNHVSRFKTFCHIQDIKQYIKHIQIIYGSALDALKETDNKAAYSSYKNLLDALYILEPTLEEKKEEKHTASNVGFEDLITVKCNFVQGVYDGYSVGLEFDDKKKADNFISSNIIKHSLYQDNTIFLKDINGIKTALNHFKKSENQIVIKLVEYINKRLSEPKEYRIFSFGYSKSEKIEAAFAALGSYIRSDGPSITVTPKQKKILCNGRLSKCIKGINITETTPQDSLRKVS